MSEISGQHLKRIIIITGASKGIGEEIAHQCNKNYNQNTLYILLARNLEKLELLKSRLTDQNKSENNVYLNVLIDFSNSHYQLVDYVIKLKDSIEHLNLQQINEILVFYNHGSLLIGRVEESVFNINEYFETNVLSVWKILSAIRTLFPIDRVPKQYHINMSTKSADHYHPFLCAFSSTRCARATIFNCLALEQPTLKILNYQPGPVYTDMLKMVYDFKTDIYESFKRDYSEKRFLTVQNVVENLLKIIENDSFVSGSAVDYFG